MVPTNDMNKSMNKSLVQKDGAATPRRVNPPSSTNTNKLTNGQNNSLTKSSKKDTMNSSLNNNIGGGLKLPN